MTDRPLAVDLYTGLHGWAEGLIDAGFHVIGFDLVDMSRDLGLAKPEHFHLVIQNVLTIHGRQLKDARLIVGSSPCTKYSYMAMPWSRAKALAVWYRDPEHPERLTELNALYDAQFRIQREACEAAGRHIPLVVENVRGACPWIGQSRAHYGSYHLWGNVPALMPAPHRREAIKAPGLGSGWVHPDDPRHVPGLDFTRLAGDAADDGRKVRGHLNQRDGHANTKHLTNPDEHEDGRKVPGFRFDGSGRSFQTASVEAHDGLKHGGDWFSDPSRQGGQTKHKPPARVSAEAPTEGRKGAGAGAVWFDQNTSSLPSASPRRKAASAKIAKIPYMLAFWIGKTYLPRDGE